MATEVLNFELTQRGTVVGVHALRTERRGGTVHMLGRLRLEGALGRSTITQQSRAHVRQYHSLHFREEQQKRGDNRTFDLQFDRASGLVKVTATGSPAAEQPLIRPYRDPLAMLTEIRQLPADAQHMTIPMLGKDVQVSLLTTVTLETPVGPRAARVYRLFPGGSLLWIGEEEPHLILKMQQRIHGSPVEVVLTGVASEAGSTRESGRKSPQRDGRRSRSRRGRRRRRRQD